MASKQYDDFAELTFLVAIFSKKIICNLFSFQHFC